MGQKPAFPWSGTPVDVVDRQPRVTLAVVRHGERLDAAKPKFWLKTKNASTYPFDCPITENGQNQASSVGHELQRRCADTTFSMVLSSPYIRCVQTSVEICKVLKIPLCIDAELGEVYGPATMGDHSPGGPRRRTTQEVLDFVPADVQVMDMPTEVDNEHSSDFIGQAPEWPESLNEARLRFASRVEQHAALGVRFGGASFVLVTHGDCVHTCLTLVLHREKMQVQNVKYCAFAILQREFVQNEVPVGLMDEGAGWVVQYGNVDLVDRSAVYDPSSCGGSYEQEENALRMIRDVRAQRFGKTRSSAVIRGGAQAECLALDRQRRLQALCGPSVESVVNRTENVNSSAVLGDRVLNECADAPTISAPLREKIMGVRAKGEHVEINKGTNEPSIRQGEDILRAPSAENLVCKLPQAVAHARTAPTSVHPNAAELQAIGARIGRGAVTEEPTADHVGDCESVCTDGGETQQIAKPPPSKLQQAICHRITGSSNEFCNDDRVFPDIVDYSPTPNDTSQRERARAPTPVTFRQRSTELQFAEPQLAEERLETIEAGKSMMDQIGDVFNARSDKEETGTGCLNSEAYTDVGTVVASRCTEVNRAIAIREFSGSEAAAGESIINPIAVCSTLPLQSKKLDNASMSPKMPASACADVISVHASVEARSKRDGAEESTIGRTVEDCLISPSDSSEHDKVLQQAARNQLIELTRGACHKATGSVIEVADIDRTFQEQSAVIIEGAREGLQAIGVNIMAPSRKGSCQAIDGPSVESLVTIADTVKVSPTLSGTSAKECVHSPTAVKAMQASVAMSQTIGERFGNGETTCKATVNLIQDCSRADADQVAASKDATRSANVAAIDTLLRLPSLDALYDRSVQGASISPYRVKSSSDLGGIAVTLNETNLPEPQAGEHIQAVDAAGQPIIGGTEDCSIVVADTIVAGKVVQRSARPQPLELINATCCSIARSDNEAGNDDRILEERQEIEVTYRI